VEDHLRAPFTLNHNPHPVVTAEECVEIKATQVKSSDGVIPDSPVAWMGRLECTFSKSEGMQYLKTIYTATFAHNLIIKDQRPVHHQQNVDYKLSHFCFCTALLPYIASKFAGYFTK
jgi:hypothetical protein